MRGTPFHSRVQALCESYNWRSWSGYAVVGKYELTHDREYYAIRDSAALIDVSPLYKYLLKGPDAMKLANRVFTRDVSKCAIGQVMYTTWCDDQGKVIDDGTISRLDEQTFRVTAAEPNLRWFQDNAFKLDVTISDISDQFGALALQGPLSRAILTQVVDKTEAAQIAQLKYFRVMEASIGGRRVTISRTGYTGDLGYEIWIPNADALPVWDTLMRVGRDYNIVPTGILALDIARIEAGLILIDVDYTPVRKALIPAQKTTPYELDLGWTVNLNKAGYFNGRSALEDESKNGSRWTTAGLEVSWDDLETLYGKAGLAPAVPYTAWRSSVPIFANTRRGEKQVGYATSGCFSPVMKKYLTLATLEPAYAQEGTELLMDVYIEHVRHQAKTRVTKKPFFDPERKRK